MKMSDIFGKKISFGDRVSGDPKLFSTCLNCKYYKKTSVERKCELTGEKTDDNCRCTRHKQR